MVLFEQKESIVKPLEIHHLYIGLALVVLGTVFHSTFLAIVGDVLAVDDSVQHLIQVVANPKFQSPIHLLYATYLWPIPWVQALNKWVNNLF